MTIRQLKKKLDQIPPTGPINLARRREIIILINKMTTGAT